MKWTLHATFQGDEGDAAEVQRIVQQVLPPASSVDLEEERDD